MARKFATDLDLLGFALLQARLHPVAADPSGLGAGDEGRVWYNTATDKFMVWNGTTAIDVLARANHTGTQLASTISDLASTVKAYRLDEFAAPTASVSMGSQKITNLLDGTAGSDAATYGQLLQFLNNQSFKPAVRAATTANIADLATGAPNTLDGVTLAANDRILVKDQTTGSQNGIYVVTTLGTGANGVWTRAEDFNTSAEAVPGSIVSVQEGTAGADKLFMLATNGPITLNTTSLTFSAYGASSGEIGVAGAGLAKTGSTYDVGAGAGISVAADAVAIDTSLVVRKVTGVIPASTSGIFSVSGATVTINHALSNSAPRLTLRAYTSPAAGYTQGEIVEVDEVASDANNLVVTLPAAPGANNWVVCVEG